MTFFDRSAVTKVTTNLPPDLTALLYAACLCSQRGVASHGSNECMEEIIKFWTLRVASGIEAGAGVVIGIAALVAIVRSFILFSRKPERQDKKEALRLQLGRWLAVGLEIELAADILRTAVAPTWTEIGQLGAIIALRTVLNYFLQKDIDKAAVREQKGPPQLAPEGHLKGPVAA